MMMNGKVFDRKQSWPTLRYYADICLEGTRKTTKNLTQHSRWPGPRFEPGTSQIRSRSVKDQFPQHL
jgi:hypothetical protein